MTSLLLALLAAGPADAICSIQNPNAGSWRTATAVVPKSAPNAQELAQREARAKLLARLCNEADCSSLEPSIYDWKAGASADSLCAGAAIEEKDFATWQRRRDVATTEFQTALTGAVSKLAERLKAAAKKGPPLVIITEVLDDGSLGGTRSRWGRLALEAALHDAQVDLASERAAGSAGRLRASIETIDASRSEFQVSLELGDRVIPGPRLSFAADIAPKGRRATRALDRDPRVRLSVDTKNGDLCDGMTTKLWLETDRKRCVVVLDAWADEALLTFPNSQHPSCFVSGRVAVNGEKTFKVVALPGVDEERYVAIAVDRLEQLPVPLQAMVKGAPKTESCRLSERQRELLDAPVPQGVARSEYRFRLMTSGPACEGIERLEPAERQAYADSLGELAACP
ncbi:MAG: hypothetical protein JNJ54_28140 [Myxococcaceae bacterium]|nr:hypothetical protein [Myxococcaceae bacterium]